MLGVCWFHCVQCQWIFAHYHMHYYAHSIIYLVWALFSSGFLRHLCVCVENALLFVHVLLVFGRANANAGVRHSLIHIGIHCEMGSAAVARRNTIVQLRVFYIRCNGNDILQLHSTELLLPLSTSSSSSIEQPKALFIWWFRRAEDME